MSSSGAWCSVYAMPPRKQSTRRITLSATGTFLNHLKFLADDTALEDTGIIRLAVAELAKKRGYIAPEPEPRKARK